MNKKDIENRLINFSVEISEWVTKLRKHPTVNHLKDQIIRSSTSAALNYGEAQSAASRKDFINKINVIMKELRETQINLGIIARLEMFSRDPRIKELMNENDQLLAIFYRTLQTAKTNLKNKDE
jgi:four helix bundle protein